MKISRLIKHLISHGRKVGSHFSSKDLEVIAKAISQSEGQHTGQICFAVEGAMDVPALLKNQSPRARAIEVFSRLKIWDTEHNNGVLIYVLIADHAVEIISDREINKSVGPNEWQAVCQGIESKFAKGNYQQGVLSAIDRLTQVLHQHFPRTHPSPNEISDNPVLLS